VAADDLASDGAGAAEDRKRRARGTIAFPYGDLSDAEELAGAVGAHFGTQCTLDQLAAVLGHQNIASGGFRSKIATAKVFGVIDAERGQALIVLTELGRRIVQPTLAAQARVTTFLTVPLYRAIYEKYRGYTLPRETALEHELVQLGVPDKQKDKARQALVRSAEQANMFSHGRDRLVVPGGLSDSTSGVTLAPPTLSSTGKDAPITEDLQQEPPSSVIPGPRFYGGGFPSDTHPLIQGLFQTLPTPGMAWPKERREKWLDTARAIFELLFTKPEEDALA
jgi:hypothetical protein